MISQEKKQAIEAYEKENPKCCRAGLVLWAIGKEPYETIEQFLEGFPLGDCIKESEGTLKHCYCGKYNDGHENNS